MPEIMTIGSALVDVFVHSANFQLTETEEGLILCQKYGDKFEVDDFEAFSGGGGSNTAVGFRRLGFETGVVAELGKDFLAQIVQRELEQNGVTIQWLIQERKERTGGSVILIGPDGGRTVMVHRGAASQLDVADVPEQILAQSRWIHLSGISGRTEVLSRIFQLVRERNLGLSWNPGKAELKLLAEGQLSQLPVTILLLNQQEWEMITAQQAILTQVIPVIVVTKGKEGGTVYVKDQSPRTYPASVVQSIDDTGAGDAFAVGFVGAHILGKNWDEAITWGVKNATSVIQRVGAKPGLLARTELERI